MTNRLRKALAGATMAAALTGLCAIPAQAAPQTPESGGFWAYSCQAGRACIVGFTTDPLKVWNIDGCGYHSINIAPDEGIAHGNAFRVTYADGRWDEVAQWSSRTLDATNAAVSVNVYC